MCQRRQTLHSFHATLTNNRPGKVQANCGFTGIKRLLYLYKSLGNWKHHVEGVTLKSLHLNGFFFQKISLRDFFTAFLRSNVQALNRFPFSERALKGSTDQINFDFPKCRNSSTQMVGILQMGVDEMNIYTTCSKLD